MWNAVPRRLTLLGLLAATVAASAGCGASPSPGSGGGSRDRSSASQAPGSRAPATRRAGRAVDPQAMDVIRAWSQALRSGDVRAAARYFALPSLLINGPGQDGEPYVTAIRSFSQAIFANASLPCGAKLISAQQRGRYVNALFRLTDRPGQGGGCGPGTGSTARTNFLIRRGRIVEWIRAPSEPGDRRAPGSGTPQV